MSSVLSDLPTLAKVTGRLDKASIPYMLTGSLALNFYGHIRATNDIDIVIQVQPAAAQVIFQLFREDFYISEEAVNKAISQQGMFNIIDNEHVFKVDFIVAKSDAYSKLKFERRKRMMLEDQEIDVIAPEDLIISKLEWSQESSSEVQENDIRNIIRISGNDLDKDYLEKWAALKGLSQRLEQIYETF